MTILIILGMLIITYICWIPIRSVLWFLTMSDYGIIDTLKWNFFKEKLWIELILIPVAIIFWWFVVGTHISIGIA